MYWLSEFSVYSILPVFFLCLYLIKKDYRQYWPFIALTIIGTITEAISLLTYYLDKSNIIFLNLFLLAEFVLILLQLRNWGLFKKGSPLLAGLIVIFFLFWLAETWYTNDLDKINNFSMVLTSFTVIVAVVLYMSRLLMEKVRNLFTDTRFLLSIGFLLYFTMSLLVFIFRDQRLQMSDLFYLNLWSIHSIANITANLIYAFGLLCIARKQISF
jgi:hypothetical protein